jgi:hypothetical protein
MRNNLKKVGTDIRRQIAATTSISTMSISTKSFTITSMDKSFFLESLVRKWFGFIRIKYTYK